MKIYTKTGDAGMTSLIGGQRIKKTDPRLEAYGSIDELNSHIGHLESIVSKSAAISTTDQQQLQNIQRQLFRISTEIATPNNKDLKTQTLLTAQSITELEQSIDGYSHLLPSLQNFILPGGHISNTQAHIARTVCRRAERHVLQLTATATVNTVICQFLNRLSDWLFIFARYCSKVHKTPEIIWKL